MDNSLVLYVLINGELKMSPGKVAAQVAHAVSGLSYNNSAFEDFASANRRTVIVLEAKNRNQIMDLQDYLDAVGIDSCVYIDEGYNEIDPYSATALAVEPFFINKEEYREIFRGFPLYPAKRKWKWRNK